MLSVLLNAGDELRNKWDKLPTFMELTTQLEKTDCKQVTKIIQLLPSVEKKTAEGNVREQ